MSIDQPRDFAIDAAGLRIAIVAARFNPKLVNNLLERVLSTLDGAGVLQEDIETLRVPGSHEIPYVCSMLARTDEFDAIIALGVVLAGETKHHDVIATSTADAFQRIATQFDIPIINGVLVVDDERQAQARCSGKMDRGREFALAALEMADLKARLCERIDNAADLDLDDLDDLFDEMRLEGDVDDDHEPWKS